MRRVPGMASPAHGILLVLCLTWTFLGVSAGVYAADGQPLILTMGAPKEFELPYAIGDVYQVDPKLISVQFAKKTAFLKIEGRQICDTTVLILDVFGTYHSTPVRVVSNSTLTAYQWLVQNFAQVPGIAITIDSNRAKVRGEILSQRIREELEAKAKTVGYICEVRFHPFVYQVLKLEPEPEPTPPPPPPPRPKAPTESKFQMSEFWTSTSYPGGSLDDIEDLPFSTYLTRMRDEIASHWRRVLERVGTPGRAASVAVKLQIGRSGRVNFAVIEKSSGIERFDRTALDAIDSASPVDALPEQLDGNTLTVHYKFTYRGGTASDSDR
ncbi:MAG: energy transducer TonB [Acidobacteria bacterium]|nr:energy transducer TonB [Acidobacteriota bacterium]